MKRRDDNHDYTERRMYMITIEVEGREHAFGELVGNAFATDDDDNKPRIELSPLGEAVQSEWMGIPRYYPQISVVAVQMMPDHLHGILFVKEKLPVHLSHVITGFKIGCNRKMKALAQMAGEAESNEGRAIVATKPPHTGNTQAEDKEASQYKSSANKTEKSASKTEESANKAESTKGYAASGFRYAAALSQLSRLGHLFAPGFNDLILRSYDELSVWVNYLHDNPRRLLMKRARPEYLRPFFGFRFGSHIYNGIGNRTLLMAPKRIAVRISRKLSLEMLQADVEKYLIAARNGAILISPSISPGEKQVMRKAFEAKMPIIVIMENGFTPLSKPKGEQFDACAEGRLLMLSPWEHHHERKTLTAYQCQQMNMMAMELCNNETTS